MKNRFIQFFSLVGLLIGLTISAQAQTVNKYEASIPFDFNIGNKTFSAGDYVFRRTNPTAYQETLTIRNLESGEMQVVLVLRTHAHDYSRISQLLFNRYEDRYFLAEMMTPTLSVKFLKAKVETRLAKRDTMRRESIALKK